MGRLQLVERPRAAVLHAALAALLAVVACGGRDDRPLVLAASSLTDVLTELGEATYVFDGSASLLRQLADGAPADALLTADRGTMDRAVAQGLARDPVLFAGNRLVIAVARGNPRGIRSLADLHRVRVATAAPGVPVEGYTAEALRRSGVAPLRGGAEPSARAIVRKVELGEVDAGVVYATDVRAPVEAVEIPAHLQLVVTYHAAALTARGRAYVAVLRSERGRAVLLRHGFSAPP